MSAKHLKVKIVNNKNNIYQPRITNKNTIENFKVIFRRKTFIALTTIAITHNNVTDVDMRHQRSAYNLRNFVKTLDQ
jgi:hypothetical protein